VSDDWPTAPVGRPLDLALQEACFADPLFSKRYEGWTPLGSGGYATVVRTFCRDRGQDIAVKIFQNLAAEDLPRFRAEVDNALRFVSPFVVRTYSPFDQGSLAWIEMELIDGASLAAVLRRGPLPREQALEVAIAVASALADAHREGVVHRDVKPGNILLPRSGKPAAKLGDFGISRFAHGPRLTRRGVLTGTPAYASPEAFRAEAVGPAGDVYALCTCLFQVFAGCLPWDLPPGAPLASFMAAHLETRPRRLRSIAKDAPRELDLLLNRGLAKQPTRRPSAQEVKEALQRIQSGPAPATASWRLPLLAGTAGGLVGLVGLVGLWALRQPPAAVPSATSLPASSRPVDAGLPLGPPPGPLRGPLQRLRRAAEALTGPVRRIQVADGAVRVHGGPEPLTDLRITLVTTAGTEHAAQLDRLAAWEQAVVSLDAFQPPLAAPLRLVRVVASTPRGPQSSELPFRE
jgi:serine/threonine-protein kinase